MALTSTAMDAYAYSVQMMETRPAAADDSGPYDALAEWRSSYVEPMSLAHEAAAMHAAQVHKEAGDEEAHEGSVEEAREACEVQTRKLVDWLRRQRT